MRRCSGLSTKNRPPSDQKAWPPSEFSPSCSRMIDPFAGIGELGRRDQPGKAAADDDRVRVGHVAPPIDRSAVSDAHAAIKRKVKSDEHR